MKFGIWALLASFALATTACDDTEKKMAEAKKVAEAEAKVAADKMKVEAEAKAKEVAAKALESGKGDLVKKITTGIADLDRKVTYLKEKAAKLPAPVKLKADAAFATFDKAKASVSAMAAVVAGAADMSAVTELSGKVTTGLAEATTALNAVEAIVVPAKK
ncbi:MAG: hypothetical protein KBF88_08380 [Polyangiaceae bacterium]|nr:hypothetical protein [Polyangiaceae bacterium]